MSAGSRRKSSHQHGQLKTEGLLGHPQSWPSASQYLISLSECIQNRAKDSGINHCRCVEAQPGKIHGDLHTKIVTDIICQEKRDSGSPLSVSWNPSPLLSHRATPKGWFSHTACTQDFMRRFRIRCSCTGNTCCMMPRAASSGTAGGGVSDPCPCTI